MRRLRGPLPALRKPFAREIEIDDRGRSAEAIHKALERLPDFGGVTIRAGKTYVTFGGDLKAGIAQLSATEIVIEPAT